jgi:GTPase SAR1 family protein
MLRQLEIRKENRTIAADVSEFTLEIPSTHSDPLTACIWDFAGQEVYYMSHSLFMSPRAAYVLVWKRPDSDDSNALEPVKAGLRRWLEMICLHVPGTQVVIVGTHCETPARNQASSDSYTRHFSLLSTHIQDYVNTVVEDLNRVIKSEDESIASKMQLEGPSNAFLRRRAFLRGIRKANISEDEIICNELRQMHIDEQSFFSVDSATGKGVRDLNVFLDELGRKLTRDVVVPKSYSLLEQSISKRDQQGKPVFGDILTKRDAVKKFVQIFQREVMNSSISLQTVNDGQEVTLEDDSDSDLDIEEVAEGAASPSQSLTAAVLRPVQVDASDENVPSVSAVIIKTLSPGANHVQADGDGIPEQLLIQPHDHIHEAEAATELAEDFTHVGLSINEQNEYLTEIGVQDSSLMKKDDHRIANSMSPEDIWQAFLFWHEMGSVFVSSCADGKNDLVIPNPQVLLEFLKPLVHADPLKMNESAHHLQNPSRNLLSSTTLERLDARDDAFRDTFISMLCKLRDNSRISVSDLKYFCKWCEIDSLAEMKTALLRLFRDSLIIDVDNKRTAEECFSDDSVLTVSARIHVSPGEFYPLPNAKYYLVYLLPIHNVCLFVHLKKALEARTRDLAFKVTCSYSSTDALSFVDIKRGDPLEVFGSQIVIQQARDKILENKFNFALLEPILRR